MAYSDYTKVTAAPVYTKDNPPTRMSEAIRMAADDVAKMLGMGFGYRWMVSNLQIPTSENKIPKKHCAACTAGAVVARLSDYAPNRYWHSFGDEWNRIMNALSMLTITTTMDPKPDEAEYQDNVLCARDEWPYGFEDAHSEIPNHHHIANPARDPAQFDTDMRALADILEAAGC